LHHQLLPLRRKTNLTAALSMCDNTTAAIQPLPVGDSKLSAP
jgi:hypothetical protein